MICYIGLPSTTPKNIGDGTNENSDITISPKPMETGLSFSSTHLKNFGLIIIFQTYHPSPYLTETRKLLARPVAPLNFIKQTTPRNI